MDDDADILRVYGDVLTAQGYAVRRFSDAAQTLAAAEASVPDLVISDVSMPGGGGLALLAKLRAGKATARVPFILMSGVRRGAESQAGGLDQGADDYLAKPLPPALMVAKVAAVLRRCAAGEAPGDRLSAGALVLDTDARTATLAGKRLVLTRKEFDLLAVFLSKTGRLLSVAFLLETVWGYDPADYSDPHTIGVHVSTLRRKIGPKLAARIVAVPSLGYRFD